MKQQALGIKLAELRKAKGLTQENLVAKCNINVRTLQRIEAGEVLPRSYTLQAILAVLEVDYAAFISQFDLSNEMRDDMAVKKQRFSFRTLAGKWSFAVYIMLLLVFGLLIKFGLPWYFYIMPALVIFLINTNDPELEYE